MTTYIFNSSSRSKILFGVFRSIKIKIRTSGLLLATSYNFVNIGIFKDFMSGVVDQHFSGYPCMDPSHLSKHQVLITHRL